MPATLIRTDGPPGVRILTLANPAKRNALDSEFLSALEAALTDDEGVRVWLVRAEGDGIFSSGYDLTALGSFPPGTPLPDERLGVVFDQLMHHPAPSVALMTGAAIGAGCELACACDFRIGSPSARFVMPPARLGVVYALKGLERIVQRVGTQPARRLFLAAHPLDAKQAQEVGILDAVSENAEGTALRWCSELAAHAPLAVSGMKRGFDLLARGAEPSALDDYEALRRQAFNSDDAREGKEAMLSRRSPHFQGR